MSETQAIKLRPGLLVTIATRIEGGVEYHRKDLEHRMDGETEVDRWETERKIADAGEFQEAAKVRSLARQMVAAACVATPFGFLICPLGDEETLHQRYAEAQEAIALFNAASHHSKVRLVMVRGQIASTDTEAIKAVRHDLAQLLESMEGAVAAGDINGIRQLATKATSLGKLLDQQSAAKGALAKAVASARLIAKTIIRRVEDGAEQLAGVLEEANTAPIAQARFLFLEDPAALATVEADTSAEGEERGAEELPGVALARFAGMADEPAPEVATP